MRFNERGALAREDVLMHAIALAAREGFAAVTFDRLASELHRSKSGIFELFGSRERLRTEMIRWSLARFQNRVVLPSRTVGGAPGLRVMLERWLDHIVSEEGLVLAIAAVTEWDEDQFRPFERIGHSQMSVIEGGVLFGVKFGQIKKDVDQGRLALDLYVLGSGSAMAVMALGEEVLERVAERIDARFAEFLTPEGAEVVARELEEYRRYAPLSRW
jgi:AcrR family transcriptional regulator